MLGVDTVIFEGVVLLYALRGSIFGCRQGFKSPPPFPFVSRGFTLAMRSPFGAGS